MLCQNITAQIGHTPLIPLTRLNPNLSGTLLAKLEGCNPGGSSKDRVALAMLDQAEATGKLAPGTTIIEPTSGNTGIALAMLCAIRKYRCIIVMPDTMSRERIALMEAYGAQVILTPGSDGMSGAVALAQELAQQIPDSHLPDQFTNSANPTAHYATTGPEIWADTQSRVDILVAGIGTGGTITGTGRFLKEKNPALRILGVEPDASPLLSQGFSAPHGIQGIGSNFVPPLLDQSLLDGILTVTEDDSRAASRLLAQQAGILAGISSGAVLHAALEVAGRPENQGKITVVILPDTGRNYLSGGLFRP